jgi:hypothetical protein
MTAVCSSSVDYFHERALLAEVADRCAEDLIGVSCVQDMSGDCHRNQYGYIWSHLDELSNDCSDSLNKARVLAPTLSLKSVDITSIREVAAATLSLAMESLDRSIAAGVWDPSDPDAYVITSPSITVPAPSNTPNSCKPDVNANGILGDNSSFSTNVWHVVLIAVLTLVSCVIGFALGKMSSKSTIEARLKTMESWYRMGGVLVPGLAGEGGEYLPPNPYAPYTIEGTRAYAGSISEKQKRRNGSIASSVSRGGAAGYDDGAGGSSRDPLLLGTSESLTHSDFD